MAIEVYVKMDDNFENVLGYSTVNANGTYIKVIQDDPVIDISKLYGYSLSNGEDSQYHLIFDEEKYNKIEAEKKKEQALKEAEEKAEQLATKSILDSASDEDAYAMRYLYDLWVPKTNYKVGDRKLYGDNLYKCKQDHTSEEGPNRTPDYLPALWDLIAPEDPTLGTIDNPIPIPEPFSSMVYVKGKYYREGDTLYLMNREGMEDGEEVSLTYKPSALVGQYFEVVSE